jgi:putative restriction endonuclease
MLDNYLESLRNLRTDKNRNRWSALTTHCAPHKPFLLLSVLDLIAQNGITSTLIEPSFDLAETFGRYWSRVMPPEKSGNMAYPFYYMQSEGFWELMPLPGCEEAIQQQISSMTRMRQVAAGARIDEELFLLMQDPKSREQLRLALIQTYFAPGIQAKLLEEGQVNQEAYAYSQELLKAENVPAEQTKPLIRDQGFRKAIIRLYEHRCAICGVRMLTPEGHTIVEAAHIVPWSESYDDRPTNGLALCRLCHWSFDEGLMGVGKDYEVLISPVARSDRNNPGLFMTLENRPIFTPDQRQYTPSQERLGWHRIERFRT